MGWTRSFLLIGLLFSISHVDAQYVLRRDFPSMTQNIPVTNLPVYGNQITPFTLPYNNVALANNQPAYNKEELKAKLVTTLEKLKLANNVLSNLNAVLNNYVTPAAKLTQAGALTGMNAPLTDLSTPLPRLRVPIVNKVPIGALRVARNLPLTNFQAGPIQTVPNNFQMFGRGVNYQSVTGIPLNNIARVPVNNVLNIPMNTFLPTNALPSYGPGRVNYWNTPWNNIQNTPIFNTAPVNNIRNIPITTTLPQANYVQRPITDIPVINANIARVPTTGIGNVPIGNVMNSPYNYIQKPSINLNNIGNMRINDLINLPLDRFTSLASNTLSRLPRANTRTGDCYSCEQLPIASSGVNKIIANVPIVPLNSLAELPAYKGLPVIKVSESVYKLTPVNSY